jgi:hypothetical protein
VTDAVFMVSYAHREEKGSDVNVASHLLVDVLSGDGVGDYWWALASHATPHATRIVRWALPVVRTALTVQQPFVGKTQPVPHSSPGRR